MASILGLPIILPVLQWIRTTTVLELLERSWILSLIVYFIIFWATGGSFIINKGKIILYFPDWWYKLVSFAWLPFNWLITFLVSRAPFIANEKPDWSLNPYLQPGLFSAATSQQLADMRVLLRKRTRHVFNEPQLMQLFDSLPPATTSLMLRNWRGKVVHTGGLLDIVDNTLGRLDLFGGEWGKRYRSPHIGDPLVLNFGERLFIPMPIWGNVSIPNTEYRGKVNATMVYDNQPWQDHFRILDDGKESGQIMLLGIWCCHEKIGGWFTLQQFNELDEATQNAHQLNSARFYVRPNSDFLRTGYGGAAITPPTATAAAARRRQSMAAHQSTPHISHNHKNGTTSTNDSYNRRVSTSSLPIAPSASATTSHIRHQSTGSSRGSNANMPPLNLPPLSTSSSAAAAAIAPIANTLASLSPTSAAAVATQLHDLATAAAQRQHQQHTTTAASGGAATIQSAPSSSVSDLNNGSTSNSDVLLSSSGVTGTSPLTVPRRLKTGSPSTSPMLGNRSLRQSRRR